MRDFALAAEQKDGLGMQAIEFARLPNRQPALLEQWSDLQSFTGGKTVSTGTPKNSASRALVRTMLGVSRTEPGSKQDFFVVHPSVDSAETYSQIGA
jgi:hypothetical protein